MRKYKIKYRWHCEGYDGDSEDIAEANTLIEAYYIMQDRCLGAYRTFYPYSIEEVEE